MAELVNLEALTALMQKLSSAPTLLEQSTSSTACWGSTTPLRFGCVEVEPLICTGRLLFCRWFSSESSEIATTTGTESFETFGVLEGTLEVVGTSNAKYRIGYGQTWTSTPGEERLLQVAEGSRGWLVSVPPDISFLRPSGCPSCNLRIAENCPNTTCPVTLPAALVPGTDGDNNGRKNGH